MTFQGDMAIPVPVHFDGHNINIITEVFTNSSLPKPKDRQSLYKTELCREWTNSGWCFYGKRCSFAHGLNELRPVFRSKKWRTKKCRNWHTQGYCPYEHRCQFLHDQTPPRRQDYSGESEGNSTGSQSQGQMQSGGASQQYFSYEIEDPNRNREGDEDSEDSESESSESDDTTPSNPAASQNIAGSQLQTPGYYHSGMGASQNKRYNMLQQNPPLSVDNVEGKQMEEDLLMYKDSSKDIDENKISEGDHNGDSNVKPGEDDIKTSESFIEAGAPTTRRKKHVPSSASSSSLSSNNSQNIPPSHEKRKSKRKKRDKKRSKKKEKSEPVIKPFNPQLSVNRNMNMNLNVNMNMNMSRGIPINVNPINMPSNLQSHSTHSHPTMQSTAGVPQSSHTRTHSSHSHTHSLSHSQQPSLSHRTHSSHTSVNSQGQQSVQSSQASQPQQSSMSNTGQQVTTPSSGNEFGNLNPFVFPPPNEQQSPAPNLPMPGDIGTIPLSATGVPLTAPVHNPTNNALNATLHERFSTAADYLNLALAHLSGLTPLQQQEFTTQLAQLFEAQAAQNAQFALQTAQHGGIPSSVTAPVPNSTSNIPVDPSNMGLETKNLFGHQALDFTTMAAMSPGLEELGLTYPLPTPSPPPMFAGGLPSIGNPTNPNDALLQGFAPPTPTTMSLLASMNSGVQANIPSISQQMGQSMTNSGSNLNTNPMANSTAPLLSTGLPIGVGGPNDPTLVQNPDFLSMGAALMSSVGNEQAMMNSNQLTEYLGGMDLQTLALATLQMQQSPSVPLVHPGISDIHMQDVINAQASTPSQTQSLVTAPAPQVNSNNPQTTQ